MIRHRYMSTQERFDACVDTKDSNECWPWNGHRDSDGYGRFKIRGIVRAAHRFALLGENECDSSNQVLHTCDHPWCCNPKHLYEGTPLDNMQDKMRRGRWKGGRKRTKPPQVKPGRAFGERGGRAKLTEEDVRTILNRHKNGETSRIIAYDYPEVSRTAIRLIVRRVNWAHIVI
jgi:uncharacterized protein (DUF433 family)